MQRNLEALSEMCGKTLALQAEGHRQLTAFLGFTQKAVSRLAADIHPPTPAKAVDQAVQHQLDGLTELYSQNIVLKSECQLA